MSTSNAEKILLMRESERINRKKFSELVGVPYSSVSSYEHGRKEMGLSVAKKIFSHPRFQKYTLWFFTDQIAPEAGQIAPALAHYGQEDKESVPLQKNAG
ncbi:helix-turn-helix transcriptional regulator [Sodalis endosymbiont of Spalangia cameroni]|uniref:helix-turn-helix domain-containing protein n=1 Tax=Sodalis praecaptivus TaxID=1239307 RepID=UPI0031F93CD2